MVDLAAKEPYFTQRCEYSDIEQDSKRMLVVQDDCRMFQKAVTVMTRLQLARLPQMVKKHSRGYTRNKSHWDRKNTMNNPVINVVSVIAEGLQIHSR